MKIIEKKQNQIVFQAKVEESLANAIRRYINQIPVLAIDEVEISKNDSALYDETVAHRIGLIPIKNEKGLDEKKNYKLKLKVKKDGMVYSKEITGNLKVCYDEVPITFLNKGQEMDIEATVKMGTGSEHSKFSPGIIFYRNVFDVKIEKDCPKEVANICPKKVFSLTDGKVTVKNSEKCDDCEACIEICEKLKKDPVKIAPKEELVITLESFGQLETGEIFKKSIDILKKDLNEISKKMGK